MAQTIVIVLLVVAAALYVGRIVYRYLSGKGPSCAGCDRTDCPSRGNSSGCGDKPS